MPQFTQLFACGGAFRLCLVWPITHNTSTDSRVQVCKQVQALISPGWDAGSSAHETGVMLDTARRFFQAVVPLTREGAKVHDTVSTKLAYR